MNDGKRSAVKQFAPDRGEDADDLDDLLEPSWGKPWRRTWRTARPRGREDIMLDLRMNEGARQAFGYSYLNDVRWVGDGSIELHFAMVAVTITGRNLLRLYEALVQHRVPYVQEGNEAEDELKPDDESHVENISIEREVIDLNDDRSGQETK